jgi:hypothetical protein
VNAAAIPEFRSTAQPGFSSFVAADPRRVRARKLVREIQVRFAAEACIVQSPEGAVHARAGDAIVTGTAGEHWRVSRAHFASKYRPVAPTVDGEPGRYASLPYEVLAVPMTAPFEVLLADGQSRLRGRGGDWLVDYGDGSLGVVSPAIFATTYEVVGVKGPARRRRRAFHEAIQNLLLIGVHMPPAAPVIEPPPPHALQPVIDAVATQHREFDQRAILFGHRYRSGFWAIYLVSALAVLCAVMPLALGWDAPGHRLHSLAALWAAGEVLLIGTVSLIFWRGQRGHWQGQWLRARTTAELTWYLPMLAPLLDFDTPSNETNWYLRVFDPGQDLRSSGEVTALCERTESLARQQLADCWSDPVFVDDYTSWASGILAGQVLYHRRVSVRQRALLHRVHAVTSWLFGLTALGAFTHLFIHTLWLSLLTTFFPALAASLHGALAQSEAYRLGHTSQRLAAQLNAAIERIRLASAATDSPVDLAALKGSIEAAIALILEEHQDWHLLIRPHSLKLG